MRMLRVLLAAALVFSVSGCSHDPGPGAVAIYGDSLTWEAGPYLKPMADDRGRPLEGSWFLGASPCDWNNAVQEEAAHHPAYVVFAFAGNKGNSCGTTAQGDQLIREYELTLRSQISTMRKAGADIVLVGPPDFAISPYKEDAPKLRTMMQKIANDLTHVAYVDGRDDISPNGFEATQPCLSSEDFTKGCTDGKITVRSTDGVHFDEPGADGYSSGAYRWAKNLFADIH
jgi:hypothetical protein